ncbi:hypothetical protein ST47_g6783 [Ascochyta rabiei]|uniref:Uncharacterized protein n=1 Tax=Didymella rabiei TaxID=5454 RepID=A0A163BYG7_DIDRA|nr:hypothetical protein ST47_g6783 [Ascochyta rabiei]
MTSRLVSTALPMHTIMIATGRASVRYLQKSKLKSVDCETTRFAIPYDITVESPSPSTPTSRGLWMLSPKHLRKTGSAKLPVEGLWLERFGGPGRTLQHVGEREVGLDGTGYLRVLI